MSEVRVDSLFTYPIKSCGGTQLSEAAVTPIGLEYDRTFMLIDEAKNFISQRTEPRLAIVRPTIEEADQPDASTLNIAAPDMAEIRVPLVADPWDDRIVLATLHGKAVTGLEVTEEADDWFSSYLGRNVKLITAADFTPRYINERYHQPGSFNEVGFADAFPMLLTTYASLEAVNTVLNEQLEEPAVPMDRFRPNIVLSGGNLEAFDEDYWRRIRIGEMIASVARPCKRCSIPYVDQATGEATGKAVGKALAMIRSGTDKTKPGDKSKGVYFGQNLMHVYEEGLMVAEGDELTIERSSLERNVELR